MYKWLYRGPVYRFGKILSYEETVEVTAATQSEAAKCVKAELRSRLKEQTIEIDMRFLRRLEKVAPKPVCPDCGTVLTDGGFCPACDDNCEDKD